MMSCKFAKSEQLQMQADDCLMSLILKGIILSDDLGVRLNSKLKFCEQIISVINIAIGVLGLI